MTTNTATTATRKTLQPSTRPTPSAHRAGGPGTYNQMAGLYDLEETLGKGHFATVKAARHVFTGERVAVKVIEKTKLDALHQKSLLKEVLCMKLVQHPHVVRLYEVIDTSSKMYLVLELGHGDLYDIIQKQPAGLPPATARLYFTQILSAVSYCHKLHVAHRDLKPENVVYFNTPAGVGSVKLTDFGFSNHFCPGVKLDTSCGSLCYSAPEILLGDSYDGPAVDIWSLGVLLYMLVSGRPPFQEANDSETLTMIMDVKYSFPPAVEPACRELIGRMLRRNPHDRADLSWIQTHEWLEGGAMDFEPLMTGEGLDERGRNAVIGQMVEGGVVGGKDEVVSALASNSYNYVTSTYYLLAEKYLKELRHVRTTEPSLTSSLESLHDKRKNSSANSDNDSEINSDNEDSLAPLDLETNYSRTRFDRTTIVEEFEDDDEEESTSSALPKPPTTTHPHSRRQHHHKHHHRYHRPQRSTSCSSSEDESGEKKAGVVDSVLRQSFRDDDEEDEPGPPGAPATSSALTPGPVGSSSIANTSSTSNNTSSSATTTTSSSSSGTKDKKRSNMGLRIFNWFFHKQSSSSDGGKIYKSKSCVDLKVNGVTAPAAVPTVAVTTTRRTDFNMNL